LTIRWRWCVSVKDYPWSIYQRRRRSGVVVVVVVVVVSYWW
jgi:hypothetical protein